MENQRPCKRHNISTLVNFQDSNYLETPKCVQIYNAVVPKPTSKYVYRERAVLLDCLFLSFPKTEKDRDSGGKGHEHETSFPENTMSQMNPKYATDQVQNSTDNHHIRF